MKMNFELDTNNKTVTIISEKEHCKNIKVISINDFIESILASTNINDIYNLSPLYKEVDGVKLIQVKQRTRKNKIFVLSFNIARYDVPIYSRTYVDTGIPKLLFAVHSVNNKLSSLYCCCVKATDISEDTELFEYPFTNVYGNDSRVCLGANNFEKGLEDNNYKKLFRVPYDFMAMPNTGHSFVQLHNSEGFSFESLLKYLQHRDFDDNLLVSKGVTYSQWIDKL